MAKQIINPGAAPIVWSTVEQAFKSINDNFNELYASLDPLGGAIDFTNLGTDLIPTITEQYDLGSSTKKWRDLYLSGSSLHLGSAVITATGSTVNLPVGSTIGGSELDNEYFREIVVAGQSTIVADAGGASALTLVAGNAGITLTTNATTDTLTITNSGILSVSQGLGITVTGSSGSLTVTNNGVRTLTPAVGGGISITGTNDLTISNTGVLQVTTFGGSGITINNPSPGVFEFVNSLPNVQQDTFRSILVAGQSTVQADSAADNLILANGTGINITTDATSDTITITNTGVTALAASGAGISVSAATGSINISNTGVTSLVAGTGISVSSGTGAVTISNTKFGFQNFAVSGNPNSIQADNDSDTFTFVPGEGVVLIPNPANDSLEINVSFINGSVFAHDSTLLVDGPGGQIIGDINTSSLRTSETRIALGSLAGVGQGNDAVAIGFAAAGTNQGDVAVSIGREAGNINQGLGSVAIGYGSGAVNQGTTAIAIGSVSGGVLQGTNAIAVGNNAGATSQGTAAIAIGYLAGYNTQSANSIVLNASGVQLNGAAAGLYIDPIREVTGPQVLYYDPSGTKEITWGPIPSGIGGGGGGDFELNVASDDSTLRRIFSGETLKFIGGSGITTSSDGEGAITISATAVSGLASRSTAAGSTGSIANAATANVTVTGFKGYLLYKIQTSAAAWVRVYTSTAARAADSGRAEGVDPSPGAGVIAEVITTGAQTVLITPGTIGFNDESPVDTNIQLAVTNKSGSPADITVTLTVLKVED